MTALLAFLLRCLVWSSLAGFAWASVATAQASALYWNWNYSGNGITASGTFVTTASPDGSGFYLITGITGTRNGATITALQPTGTAIPGNEPFAVDNLLRLDGPQLTHNGFGYAIADGTYANPFYADFLDPARYLEFFSAPPFTGGLGSEDSELPISFAATLIAIAEPDTWALLLIGLAVLGCGSLRKRQTPARVFMHDFENRGGVRAGFVNFSSPGPFEPDIPSIAEWFIQNPPKDTTA